MATLQQVERRAVARVQFKIEADVAPRVNLAFQQNGVPVVRALKIACLEGDRLEDLTLVMRAEPAELADEQTWRIASIEAGEEIALAERDVVLKPGLLSNLTEPVLGELNFELLAGGELLAAESREVRLLAHNDWVGFDEGVELLAAFVTPNDPVIEPILKEASKLLSKRSKQGGAINGYMSGSREHVWELASAIWTIIRSRRIEYAVPPASFERRGQKVRLPAQIANGGIATCLDTSVLFAAALEQAGLNPFIVLTDGHAFPGVWLTPAEFPSIVTEDPVALRARIRNDDAIVFESTLVTETKRAGFSGAIRAAEAHIAAEREGEFVCVIDVKRARMMDIQPLGSRVAPGDAPQRETKGAVEFERAPHLPDFAIEPAEPGPVERLDRWKSRLLDLSLRNPLLNLRTGKTVLDLAGIAADKVADVLDAENMLFPQPVPDLSLGGERARSKADEQELLGKYAKEALERGEVLIADTKDGLEARLVHLHRQAQQDLREGGAATIHLALGFLKWRRSIGEARAYRAPLILTPLEIERRSATSPIRLKRTDVPAVFNATLIEMLRKDFGLDLSSLESDFAATLEEAGVRGVVHAVGAKITDLTGWEVSYGAAVARFSFQKHLMWRDLAARERKVRENPIVGSLLSNEYASFRDADPFPAPSALDDAIAPSASFTPLSADSSQLVAVRAAAAGKSFVLVGPPGTGKSQTIANMIAQCLADGKKVLFVAEKIAALDVVAKRLERIGLRDLCLELHSNRVGRLHVVDQLNKAWRTIGREGPEEWRSASAELAHVRAALNNTAARMHGPDETGMTPYRAMGAAARGRDVVALDLRALDLGDLDAMARARAIADKCDLLNRDLGGVVSSPYSAVRQDHWSPRLRDEMDRAANDLREAARAVSDAWPAAAGALELDADQRGKAAIDLVASLARTLSALSPGDAELALEPEARAHKRAFSDAVQLLRRRMRFANEIARDYALNRVKRLDIDALRARWRDAAAETWLRALVKRQRVRAALGRAALRPVPRDVGAELERLAALKRLDEGIARYGDLEPVSGGVWRGLGTNREAFEAFAAAAAVADRILGAAENDAAGRARLSRLRERLLTWEARPELSAFADAADALDAALQAAAAVADAAPADLVDENAPDWLRACDELGAAWRGAEGELASWCAWRRVRREAVEAGLAQLVEAVEAGDIDAGGARDAVEVNAARAWLARAYDNDAELASFSRPEQEDAVRRFAALDQRHADLGAEAVLARLGDRAPPREGEVSEERWRELKRELNKRRSSVSVRDLLHRSGDEIAELAPCFLMSPISVAQYLHANHSGFDVVIFDEASQIPVWDAVGAIARAPQAIVVGDPNQLPPTSFFRRGEDDSEFEETGAEDLESILDECIASGLPTWRLNWHYRSRSERLIAYSNHRYYDGDLVTFPAPVAQDRAVSLVQVDGVYERGGKRVNRAEAEAIVGDIVDRLTSRDRSVRDASIGVITLNAEQQRLIEDLLDQERKTNEELERFFADEGDEPLFVKNLESVQGDERDVILLSVGYGPDPDGRVSMNFGPLNRLGGERRLNVAITRARREMRVFASLHVEDIDVTRTRATGVADLRGFLNFARAHGEVSVRGKGKAAADALAQAIVEDLTRRGWTARAGVGVSDFKVAVGVEHPERPGTYLAGVETDGPVYARAATARDREILRRSVLEGLNWRVKRVWAADWFSDPDGARARLDAELRALAGVHGAAD